MSESGREPSSFPAGHHHSASLYRAWPFSIAEKVARLFPLALTRTLAGWSGWLYAVTHPAHTEVVRRNLRLLDAGANEADARRVYAEFGKTMADYFFIGTRPPEEAARIIGHIDGEEHLREAHRLGKGALIVTGHLGLFELGGLLLGRLGIPGTVLTFPEPSRALTEWRARFRRRWKMETLEVGADSFAFVQIAQRLRAGEFVATLIDRPPSSEGTPVNLPCGTTRFSSGILLLAAPGGVPVLPATMVRRADGFYEARIFPPIFVQPRESRAETLQVYSQQIADKLASVLCAHPEQWYQFVPLSSPS